MRLAAEAGVKVAMGTDCPVAPHGTNLNELIHMAANGYTPEQALVAATSSAAELMGLQDELGTLEPGKRADVVVVDGDPLAFDTLKERIAQVWKDGVRVVPFAGSIRHRARARRIRSWGTADFLGGVSTKRLSILTVSAVSQFVGLLFTGGLVLATGAAMPGQHALLYGLGAGFLGTVGLVALYSGLAIGPMGVVAPIVATSAIVPVVAGLLQGERPEPIQLVGAVLAIGGVALAARHRDEAGARVHPRAVVLALVAAVGLGADRSCCSTRRRPTAPHGPCSWFASARCRSCRSRCWFGVPRSRWTRSRPRPSRGSACSTTGRTCCSCWPPSGACSA